MSEIILHYNAITRSLKPKFVTADTE